MLFITIKDLIEIKKNNNLYQRCNSYIYDWPQWCSTKKSVTMSSLHLSPPPPHSPSEKSDSGSNNYNNHVQWNIGMFFKHTLFTKYIFEYVRK